MLVAGTHATLWAALLATSGPEPAVPTHEVRYDGYAYVRAQIGSRAMMERALEIADRVASDHAHLGTVDFLLAPGALATWHMAGFPDYDVISTNIQTEIELERERLAANVELRRQDFFADFQDYDAIFAYLDELQEFAPERVDLHDLDPTLEGNTIRAIEIRGKGGKTKPIAYHNGTMHAREWLSPMTVMYFADRMVRDYGEDEDVTFILDRMRIFIVPVLNADGYLYSWNGNRLWRKNRRGGYGVDLNRNWDKGWKSGSNTGAEDYPGESAFSEPETQSVRDFVADYEVIGFTDWHTPIEQVMCPFFGGGTPHHADEHRSWAGEMADAINAVHGKNYGKCRNFYREGMGLMVDWFVEDQNGAPGAMGWLVEMRGPGFEVPAREILPNAEENYAAFLVSMRHVADVFGVEGDDDDDDDDDTDTDDTDTDDTDTDATGDSGSSESADDDSSSEDDSSDSSGDGGDGSGSEGDADGSSADDEASGDSGDQGSGDSGDDAADEDDTADAGDSDPGVAESSEGGNVDGSSGCRSVTSPVSWRRLALRIVGLRGSLSPSFFGGAMPRTSGYRGIPGDTGGIVGEVPLGLPCASAEGTMLAALMFLATDTHYTPSLARVAGVTFEAWDDERPRDCFSLERAITDVSEYEPGQFYRRELPLIQALLAELPEAPQCIVVDGYVHLDGTGRPGLGAHLHRALGERVAVIGVAKNSFAGSEHAVAVLRGESRRPLYVTAAGVNLEDAASRIRGMAGKHRMPTLLQRVDGLSRGLEPVGPA